MNTVPFGLVVSHPMTGVSVVSVSGELDMATAPKLVEHVKAELTAGAQHLVIDLVAVDFLGSAGLTALLQSSQSLAEVIPGAVLHLSGTSRRVVHRPLEATGLFPLFSVHLDVDEALSKIDVAD